MNNVQIFDPQGPTLGPSTEILALCDIDFTEMGLLFYVEIEVMLN